MGVGLSSLSGLTGLSGSFGRGYVDKVLSYHPIAFFPLWEPSGAVSEEVVHGWDGVYTGVTLGQPGLGGRLCPYFDGVNDFDNIYTTGLRDAFNGAEGSVLIWARMFNVGVWTDATLRLALRLRVDANNQIQLLKRTQVNDLRFIYTAGGVTSARIITGLTTTDWMVFGLTWSASADEVKPYLNGVQQGATVAGLGVWAGTLTSNVCVIGANTTVPAAPWHGWLNFGMIFDRAFSELAMEDLAKI